MDDLTALIGSAFGGRLVIDRELGGGGMSRVFLATESRIHRQVVIKVLLPELSAGVSAERFRREIEMAARLQHPHIVPLLEVGMGEDVVCYTMPYVEGEAVRVRLERERALPVSDAVRIWRELLDALSYAHAHGVVHRDIKPENVLLSGRHAMVTDFGVAKALGEAAAADGITGTGVSLGTPAYMSPEQAAGDARLDHRSDLYSAGLLMWEMLAGYHPFAGLAPHQMLAAHAAREVPPLLEARPVMPAPLAGLVERCLAKNPADRPISAEAVLSSLEAIAITDPGRTVEAPPRSASEVNARPTLGTVLRPRISRRALTAAALLVGAFMGFKALARPDGPVPLKTGAAGLRREEAAADSVARRADALFRMVAVLAAPGKPEDATLRRQAREIVESVLRRDSMLFVPSSEQIAGYMRNARIAERFIADPDTMRAVARSMAHAIVSVDLAPFGTSFTVTTAVIRTDVGNTIATFAADGADSASLPHVLRVLADSARHSIRRVAPQLQLTGDGRFASPTAVRLLNEARRHNSARDYLVAVELARAATRADTNYVEAWQLLSTYLENARMNRAEMLDAQSRAYRLKHRTTELIAGVIARDYFARTKQLGAAVAAIDSLAAVGVRRSLPPAANHENSAGLVRMAQGEFVLAERHYRRAIDLNRGGRPWLAHSNLVGALVRQGKVVAADSMIRAIEAQDSTGVILRRARELRALTSNDYDAVMAMARADLTSPDRPEYAKAMSLFRLGAASAVKGRPHEGDSIAAIGEETIARFGDPGLAFHSALTRAVLHLTLTGDSATARRIVTDSERRYAPTTLRFMDRRHAEQAVARAVLGDVAEARRILDQWQREVPPEYRRVDARSMADAHGEIALAERRPADALAFFRTGDIGICGQCRHVNVARSFDALAQADSAVVYFEQYLRTPADDRLGLSMQWRPVAFKRLGELYEQQGQRAKAIESYEALVSLWKDAEPEQQRVVADVKERIAKLRRVIG